MHWSAHCSCRVSTIFPAICCSSRSRNRFATQFLPLYASSAIVQRSWFRSRIIMRNIYASASAANAVSSFILNQRRCRERRRSAFLNIGTGQFCCRSLHKCVNSAESARCCCEQKTRYVFVLRTRSTATTRDRRVSHTLQ